MPLDNNELLKPRWKVIGSYPESKIPVGSIITQCVIEGDEDFEADYSMFDEYPHLFKKLEWWEHRTIEDMPEYIKCIFDCRIPENTILKANCETYDKYPAIMAHRGLNPDFWIEAEYFVPSTEAEYLSSIKH